MATGAAPGTVSSVSPDGLVPCSRRRLLAGASSAGLPPQPVFTFHGHPDEVAAVCFAYGSRFLVTGDVAGNVFVWNTRTKRRIVRWTAHAKALLEVSSLCIDNQKSLANAGGDPGEFLFTQARDDELRVWKLCEDGSVLGAPVSRVPANGIGFCRFSLATFNVARPPDSVDEVASQFCSLAVAVPSLRDPNLVELWDPLGRRLLAPSIGFKDVDAKRRSGMCMGVELMQDRCTSLSLLTAYESGDIAMWRSNLGSRETAVTKMTVKDMQLVWKAKYHPEPVMALAYSGRFCFSGSVDNRLVVLNLDVEHPVERPESREIQLKAMGVSDIRVRDDGRIFATAGWDGKVRLFSTKTAKPLAVLAFHKVSARSLAFSTAAEPGPHYVASASTDRRVCLWEVF